MNCDKDRNYNDPAESKPAHSSLSTHTGDSPKSHSSKRRHKSKKRSRSPRKRSRSFPKTSDEDNLDRKTTSSRDPGNLVDSKSYITSRKRLNCSREDSGYGDEHENYPGGSSSNQKTDTTKRDKWHQSSKEDQSIQKSSRSRDPLGNSGSAKNIPWVPPPLPKHLRQIPPVTKIGYPVCLGRPFACPQQNQFQNDGSFLEVFHQHMQTANSLQQSGEMSVSSATELGSQTTAGKGPIVTKRRMSKPLKTGMVQKPKKKVDECDLEAKDSWSLYMKEVQKYRANKCINSEACRPLMK